MRIKFEINGQSLRSYLVAKGYEENKIKTVYARIRNKGLTPEQAINFQMPKSTLDKHTRELIYRRRYNGWSEELIAKNLTPDEGRKLGHWKRVKTLYHGKKLGDWAKEYGFSYGCLRHRVVDKQIPILEAISYPSKAMR